MNENQKISNNLYWRNAVIVPGIERLIISIIFNCIFGLAVLVGLKSLGIITIAAIILALISALTGVILLTKRLPIELIGIRKQKFLLSVAWLVMALIAFLMIGRLSVFMIDPTLFQYSLFPGDKWMVEHCCLTAYSESTRLSDTGEYNIYDQNHYLEQNGKRDSNGLIPFRKVSSFKVDLYHYPPTFLLLPITARAVVGDNFLDLRMLWFSLSVLSLMAAIGFMIFRCAIT